MDSQFQVKITADISELQSRLKSVEAITGKFKQSMDNAASATKNLEQSANRGRLVAFAFGQVIRDAGFFSQSFALGILAISNNIPILIDQLAQMANLSQKAMSAVSLLGSALTAGLTIYAYYAQGIKDANAEYNKAIEGAKKSSESQIATVQSLISIAQDETLSYAARKQAVDELNKIIPQLNNNLTVQNVNSKEQLSILNQLPKAIELQAKAQALATLIGEEYARNLKAQNSSLEDQASFLAKTGAYFQKFIMGNEAGAAFILAKSGAEEFGKTITSTQDNIKKYRDMQDEANRKLAEMGFLTEGTKKKTSEYADALKSLSDELKKINADTSLTFNERNKALVEAYKSAIDSLATVGTGQASAKILELRDAIFELNKEIYKSEGNAVAAKLFSIKTSQDAKDATEAERQAAEELANEWERGLYTLDPLYQQAAEAAKNLGIQQKAANESVTALVRSVGGDLVNAFTLMLETGNMSFSGIIKVIGSMIKRLIAAVAAAALLSVILGSIFPKSTKVDFKSIFGMLSGLNLAGGAPVPNAKGGIYSGPTNALVAEYPGARSNPEVIAPLDKLQSILGTSGGSQIGAVIAETRVSGNDLAILIKRADRNRNGNY